MSTRNLAGAILIAAGILTAGSGSLWAADTAPQSKQDARVAGLAMQGNREGVRLLLKQNAAVNGAQGDGMTALHWAAYRNDLEMAKMLIAAGADVKAATRIEGLTPLAMACTNGNAAIIEVLLKAGSDVNLAGGIWTPLMLASSSGSADAVKVLLEHGADVNAKESSHHQTAAMFAAARNRDAVIAVLASHGADLNVSSDVISLERQRFDDNGNPLPVAATGQ